MEAVLTTSQPNEEYVRRFHYEFTIDFDNEQDLAEMLIALKAAFPTGKIRRISNW